MTQRNMFSCSKQSCIVSCCGEFLGFSDRLNSVDGRVFSEIILTDEDAKNILCSEFKNLVYCGTDGLFRIATTENGCCGAFQSGRCTINDLKPTICRCFPLYLDLFIGLCSQKECQAVATEYTLASYKNELPYFLKMCEFWLEYYKKLYKTI